MSWGTAISALAGLGSAAIGAYANNRAANQVREGIDDAAARQDAAFREAMAYAAPYREGGLADYNALRAQIGSTFQASPGYEFARGEGIRAIDQAASARGLLNSGGRLRELTRYGTGVANQEYNNWLSRLQGLAAAGQAASGTAASLAQQQGIQQGNLAVMGGQANAGATTGVANALLGGLNQGLGLYGLMR